MIKFFGYAGVGVLSVGFTLLCVMIWTGDISLR